jgi:hypothetical protein
MFSEEQKAVLLAAIQREIDLLTQRHIVGVDPNKGTFWGQFVCSYSGEVCQHGFCGGGQRYPAFYKDPFHFVENTDAFRKAFPNKRQGEWVTIEELSELSPEQLLDLVRNRPWNAKIHILQNSVMSERGMIRHRESNNAFDAEMRAKEAEEKAKEAEAKLKEAEAKLKEAEEKAKNIIDEAEARENEIAAQLTASQYALLSQAPPRVPCYFCDSPNFFCDINRCVNFQLRNYCTEYNIPFSFTYFPTLC